LGARPYRGAGRGAGGGLVAGLAARLASRAAARRQGRRLVVGGDEAAPRHALPARAAVQGADVDPDRLASRRDPPAPPPPPVLVGGGGRRGPSPPAACARLDRRRLRRRRWARDRLLLRADLLHRLDRRADARRPPQPPLPASAAPVARLLRAQPRG